MPKLTRIVFCCALRHAASFTVIALVGCAAAQGPVTDRPQLIARSLPESEEIQFSSAATWIPDTDGYGEIFSSQPSLHGGTLVLAETATSFVQWSEEERSYHILWRSPYSDIASCRVDAYGRGRRLVIQQRDFRTESFEITGPSGTAVDLANTRQAFVLLTKHVSCHAR